MAATAFARTKLAVMGMATATAAVMALGPASPVAAAATNIDQDVYTTGPLAGVLAGLGLTSIGPIPVTNVGGEDITLTLQLVGPVDNNPQALYDTVNGLDFVKRGLPNLVTGAYTYDRVVCTTGGTCATPNEFPALLGIGTGANNLVQAYRDEIASVQGSTPDGFTPFAAPGKEKQSWPIPCGGINPNNCPLVQPTNQTNQALLFLRSWYRPNGGIVSRFGPLLNLFGVDTTVPDAGVYASDNSATPGIKLNTATLDLTWAYDPLSDFPETFNPFSLLNTAFAALPTNLLGGVEIEGLDAVAAGLNIAGTLGIVNRVSLGLLPISDGKAWYGTLLPKDLPILEPLRLPSRIINALAGALGFNLNLGTPLADALQPAFKILVNTGYTDVITPDKLDTCATDCGTADAKTYADLGYTAYDRSFLTSGDYTPFLSQAPLTPQEWLQVPGDVVKALIGGFTDEIKHIFGGAAAVNSVPSSVSASLKDSATQAISPTTSSESPDPTPVTAPADDTTPADTSAVRVAKGSAAVNSPTRDANKATPHRTRGSASDNAGGGKHSKKDSPSRAAPSRSAKPAA